MKVTKSLLFFAATLIMLHAISSCERDDICAENTPTTPLLIIRFIDNNDGITFKSPTDLRVKSTDSDITENFLDAITQDSIAIPLKTTESITEFEFTINANSEDPDIIANTDTVSFQYTISEEYVSTACGFRVIYNTLTRTLTNEDGEGNWIKDIRIQQLEVNNENAAHVYIFH
ncbi:DUF6452 family protein [Aquimarina sp. MMG016]|uniref:DUF6452 family protein n=1 Tax=Aquimarina sp. MMG016 TaxID=2822690 RepID=UPI001B3A389B|nr:DUF6452 family protein [Aquimarina sp. MMG016]MBQ4821235.1 hypothetical protein [Aquimarina sp. MMG016]